MKKGNKADKRSTLERALEDSTLKSHYLKEAEKLFMGPKGSPEHDKDLQKLHDTWGKKGFAQVVERYVAKYGLPDDWSALILILDLEDRPELVCEAMDKLVEASATGNATELRGLESRLRIMEMTASDPAIQEAAQDALSRLS